MSQSPIPPLEDLLTHRRWVQGVARRLLRDEQAAEDLAQEAWVRVMRSPPDPARDPKPWLRRVLKNLASNTLRGTGRRRAHEAAWREPREQRSPEALVAEAEQHRRLVDLVMDLEEPFKTALVLRFYEGLGPKEIAERLDLPVGTVHSRIARAVERLKTRLDEEENGDRRAWIAGLVPLAGLDRAAPAAAATATITHASLLGILAMTFSKPKIALLTLLLVGSLVTGGIWLALDSHGKEPAREEVLDLRSEATDATLKGRSKAAVAEADPGPGAPGTAPSPSDLAGVRTVRGTLRDAAGRPVAGAEVFVLPAASPGLDDDEFDDPRFGRVQTTADGGFEVRFTEPGPVRLLAFAKRHVAGSVLLDEQTPDGSIDLALKEPWRLRVRVSNADGVWPANCRVDFLDWSIDPIDRAVDPSRQYLDLELQAPESGNVHEVALHRTDSAWFFVFPPRGMAAMPGAMRIEQPTEEVTIRLVRSAKLRVRLLDAATGELLPADLDVTGWMGNRSQGTTAWSFGARGPHQSQTSRIAPGRYDLEFDVAGYETWKQEVSFQTEGEERTLDVRLQPQRRGGSAGRLVLDLVGDETSSEALLTLAHLPPSARPLEREFEMFARMREGDLEEWKRIWGTSGGWADLWLTRHEDGSVEVQQSLHPLQDAHMPTGTYDLYVAERRTGRAAFVAGLRVFGDRENRYEVRLQPGTMFKVDAVLPEEGVFTGFEVRTAEAGRLPLVVFRANGTQTFNTPLQLEYLLRTPRKPLLLGPFPAASVEVHLVDEHKQSRTLTVQGAGQVVR